MNPIKPGIYKHVHCNDMAILVPLEAEYDPRREGWELSVLYLNVVNLKRAYIMDPELDKIFIHANIRNKWVELTDKECVS